MNALARVRAELEQLGPAHDAAEPDRRRRLVNVTPDTGPLLALLVRAAGARRVLEVGTSNGYSTLWLAEAARDTGGRVTTVECLDAKAALARDTFARAGVGALVDLRVADAGAVLAAAADAAFDFVFLDADRARYAAWWPDVARVLAPGGLLVVDNATSHAAELAGRGPAAFPLTTHAVRAQGHRECERVAEGTPVHVARVARPVVGPVQRGGPPQAHPCHHPAREAADKVAGGCRGAVPVHSGVAAQHAGLPLPPRPAAGARRRATECRGQAGTPS